MGTCLIQIKMMMIMMMMMMMMNNLSNSIRLAVPGVLFPSILLSITFLDNKL